MTKKPATKINKLPSKQINKTSCKQNDKLPRVYFTIAKGYQNNF